MMKKKGGVILGDEGKDRSHLGLLNFPSRTLSSKNQEGTEKADGRGRELSKGMAHATFVHSSLLSRCVK